jgi:hypothetical protein
MLLVQAGHTDTVEWRIIVQDWKCWIIICLDMPKMDQLTWGNRAGLERKCPLQCNCAT